MAIGKLIGLAAIGGLLYAHKRHGGQFTVESFNKSARDLMDGAKTRARDLKAMAERRLEPTENRIDSAKDTGASTSGTQSGSTDFRSGSPVKAF